MRFPAPETPRGRPSPASQDLQPTPRSIPRCAARCDAGGRPRGAGQRVGARRRASSPPGRPESGSGWVGECQAMPLGAGRGEGRRYPGANLDWATPGPHPCKGRHGSARRSGSQQGRQSVTVGMSPTGNALVKRKPPVDDLLGQPYKSFGLTARRQLVDLAGGSNRSVWEAFRAPRGRPLWYAVVPPQLVRSISHDSIVEREEFDSHSGQRSAGCHGGHHGRARGSVWWMPHVRSR